MVAFAAIPFGVLGPTRYEMQPMAMNGCSEVLGVVVVGGSLRLAETVVGGARLLHGVEQRIWARRKCGNKTQLSDNIITVDKAIPD